MTIVLFDNKQRKKLFPFSAARAVADIKIGMFTNKERWAFYSNQAIEVLTTSELQDFYNPLPTGDIILIDASVICTNHLLKKILGLQIGHYLSYSKGFIAGRIFNEEPIALNLVFDIAFNEIHQYKEEVVRVDYAHQIFELNKLITEQDFVSYSAQNTSKNIDESNTIVAPSQIFIEDGADIKCSILNASNGPIYIGKNATIMEGCLIRGPFILGENSVLKMGTKIYGATSIGNNCVVGGEVKNVVMFNNSNKAHDGYLGDSVIGEWCNIGAGTCNSNIKNTGGNVHIWNEASNNFIEAGQKCGVLMGHYTRVAINSSINTGSVYGVSCNVFGNGLLPKKIESFCWGTNEKYEKEKAINDIANWQKLKNTEMTEQEKSLIQNIYY